MEEETPKLTPQQELKKQIKDLRAQYKSVQKLLVEVQAFHNRFIKLRDVLENKESGVRVNLAEAAKHKKLMNDAVNTAKKKLEEVEANSTDIQAKIDEVNSRYKDFTDTSDRVFDSENGFDALHEAAKTLKESISQFEESSSTAAATVNEKLAEINDRNQKVLESYVVFEEQKAKLDDPESGILAQLNSAKEYAEAASKAKLSAESELATTTSLRERSEVLLGSMDSSNKQIEELKAKSEVLTQGIANTLNKASAYSLSKALQDRAEKLDKQLKFWGVAQGLAILALACGVGAVFYALFFHNASAAEITRRLSEGPTLVSVISKILFTSPFVFAVYFTTTNFSHTRDLRDKYAWKETVSKNFQNYIKLVKDEFSDPKHENERFNFSMRTISSIYKEPTNPSKKKKYNLGINKIFNVALEEEDLKDIFEESLEEVVTHKVEEEAASAAAENAISKSVKKTKKTTEPK